MDPITPGSTGAAVEDIQERLVRLDYAIDDSEREKNTYGPSTAKAVARFRLDHDLSLGEDVDTATWMLLVDESYQLGDRTLYLRLPNFHGNDVRQLQERLNILGFSCGKPDGQYGVHTEAAVKLFQESVGELADGMAFKTPWTPSNACVMSGPASRQKARIPKAAWGLHEPQTYWRPSSLPSREKTPLPETLRDAW